MTTNINIDIQYISLNNVWFWNLNFENQTGGSVYFYNCNRCSFNVCSFKANNALYTFLYFNSSNFIEVTNCYVEHESDNAAGEAIEITNSYYIKFQANSINNTAVTLGEGMDFKRTHGCLVANNCFYNCNYAIKVEVSEIYILGNYAESCTSLIAMAENGFIRIMESDYVDNENMNLVDTDYLLTEIDAATNIGRFVKLPNMTIDSLGTGAFSASLTNLTSDLATSQHIQIGSGSMTYYIDSVEQ
jgi:hypothetical protein